MDKRGHSGYFPFREVFPGAGRRGRAICFSCFAISLLLALLPALPATAEERGGGYTGGAAEGDAGSAAVAWGRNHQGQCNVPFSNYGFTAVAAGAFHNLALRSDGSIAAWGVNSYGQLNIPAPNSGFTAMAAGAHHNLALRCDASIDAWGYNDSGQCDVPAPNSGFTAVAGGWSHSMALRSDGSIAAWGDNYNGQCDVPAPNSGFTAVAAGWSHSLALRSDGSIAAWGHNGFGQCDVPAPNSGFVAVAGGRSHSLALRSDGSIEVWGGNWLGQCDVPAPNSGFTAVAAGGYHSLALRSDGSIEAWGDNEYGQCDVPSLDSDFTAVAGGGFHSLALRPAMPADTWFLAEGATAGGFETWVLVQNPGEDTVTVDLDFMTSTGPQPGPQGVHIPPYSRVSFDAGQYVTDYNVSTRVTSTGGVVCERAMYGNGRTWAHCSVGTTRAASQWFLAEGATAGGFETWVLVQNPGEDTVTVDLDFMTSTGPQPGPQGVHIPPYSRVSFDAGQYVTDYNVSTRVTSTGGVVCERAMYGNGRTWAHCSVGTTRAASQWFLAEGATAGGFETWVLVQNPGEDTVTVDLDFMASTGPQPGPQGVHIPPYSRVSFDAGQYVTDYNVSTRVTSTGGVVCERAMYGNGRTWAHCSVGTTRAASQWFLAEGATAGGFETWVLVQNPGEDTVTVDLDFMASTGQQPGPQGVHIPPYSRVSFDAGQYVTDYNVSTRVTSTGGVVCERAMYGNGRTWAHCSVVYTPPF